MPLNFHFGWNERFLISFACSFSIGPSPSTNVECNTSLKEQLSSVSCGTLRCWTTVPLLHAWGYRCFWVQIANSDQARIQEYDDKLIELNGRLDRNLQAQIAGDWARVEDDSMCSESIYNKVLHLGAVNGGEKVPVGLRTCDFSGAAIYTNTRSAMTLPKRIEKFLQHYTC